jgi:precorrin-3B methylase
VGSNGVDNTDKKPLGGPYQVFIVGTGVIPGLHLTREAEAAIRGSNEVLYVDKSFGIQDVLGRLSSRLTDLHAASYREGTGRLDAYRTMASLVVEAALDHAPVTFALYGHPLVYALPPFMVIAAAEALGLRVKVLPGISSLDAMFADLRFDPCTQGVQMYEATDLLLRKRPIQPDVPCFLWQIGTVGTRIYSEASSKPDRFSKIKEYLLNFYPPNHRMVAVYSSDIPLMPPTFTEFCLDNIEANASSLHQGVTLFIPPVNLRPPSDEEMLNSMDDLEQLKQVTLPRM